MLTQYGFCLQKWKAQLPGGWAPSYFKSLPQVYIPTRSLQSVNERRLVVPSQRASKPLYNDNIIAVVIGIQSFVLAVAFILYLQSEMLVSES